MRVYFRFLIKKLLFHTILRNISLFTRVSYNRDIRKVRKSQGQYPEFGHRQGEIKRKPAKKVH